MPNPQENNSNLTDKVNKIGLKAKDDISPTKTKAKGSEEEAEDDDKSPDTSPLKPLSFGKEPSVKPFGNGFASTFGSSSTTSFKGSHTTFGGGKSLGFNSFASSKTTFGNSNDQKVQTSFGSGSAFATTEEQEVEEEKKFQQQDGFRGLMIGKLINLIIVVTGEEGEELMDSLRCKLFVWNTDGDEWKERGVGMLKVSKIDAEKYRLVMRSDGVLRVILNARIQPQMPLHVRNEKYLEFYAPESEKMVKFLCKCKNGEVARRFEKTVKACLPPPKRRIEGDGSSDEEKNEKRVKVNPKTAKEPTTGKEAPVKSTSKVDAKNIPKLDDKSKFNESNNLKSVDKEEEAKTKVKFDSKDQLKPKATGTGTGDSKASPERKEMLVTPEKVGKVEKK